MIPTSQRIAEVFDYRDGALYRKGSAAKGYLRPDGYVYVRLDGRSFGEHRLVYCLFTNEWPPQIDHIDGVRGNNHRENLRAATHAQNCMNRRALSKAKGCYWQAKRKRWIVQIGANGVRKTIGYFTDLNAARSAYRCAAGLLHGDFARS